ncbi:MAG: aminoacyl-tRNA hydrolase [Minisyncoccia bacterium]|jgi:PTH1 family peptidyl-tRNA hydrolase
MKAVKTILVGIGNPGPEFENTYHNVGRAALATIARRLPNGESLAWKTHKKLFRYAAHGTMVLVAPLTFMNESGRAVREAMKKFKAAPEDLVVVHDESDLPVGTYKISFGRGSAGNKGIQSIITTLRTNRFTRIRIGIREAGEKKHRKASAFVLVKITPKDRVVFDALFSAIATRF